MERAEIRVYKICFNSMFKHANKQETGKQMNKRKNEQSSKGEPNKQFDQTNKQTSRQRGKAESKCTKNATKKDRMGMKESKGVKRKKRQEGKPKKYQSAKQFIDEVIYTLIK